MLAAKQDCTVKHIGWYPVDAAWVELCLQGVMPGSTLSLHKVSKTFYIDASLLQTGFDYGNIFNIELPPPEWWIDRFEIVGKPVTIFLHHP